MYYTYYNIKYYIIYIIILIYSVVLKVRRGHANVSINTAIC